MVFSTLIYAISPLTGEITTYVGPNIFAENKQIARDICEKRGLGYCHISDQLISEIPCKEGSCEPDFNKEVDFEDIVLN